MSNLSGSYLSRTLKCKPTELVIFDNPPPPHNHCIQTFIFYSFLQNIQTFSFHSFNQNLKITLKSSFKKIKRGRPLNKFSHWILSSHWTKSESCDQMLSSDWLRWAMTQLEPLQGKAVNKNYENSKFYYFNTNFV